MHTQPGALIRTNSRRSPTTSCGRILRLLSVAFVVCLWRRLAVFFGIAVVAGNESLRKKPLIARRFAAISFARGARARGAVQWLIAALNSIEPFLMNVALIDLFYANEEWAKLRRPGAVDFAKRRLAGLSKSLGDKPYLDGDRFTAGDLMMRTVLRILKHTDIVTSDKRLAAYIDRCTARPAFKRALDAQVGDFREAA